METTRASLEFFVDACVEVLEPSLLKMTPMTRYAWDGVDKKLVDRILWELEDQSPEEVATLLSVKLSFVQSCSRLAGANGSG